MDEEYHIETYARNLQLFAILGDYWDAENLMFFRDEPEAGLSFGLIPQLFNIKVTVGKINEKDFHYDGY